MTVVRPGFAQGEARRVPEEIVAGGRVEIDGELWVEPGVIFVFEPPVGNGIHAQICPDICAWRWVGDYAWLSSGPPLDVTEEMKRDLDSVDRSTLASFMVKYAEYQTSPK